MRWYPALFRRFGCLLALGMLVAIVIAVWKLGEPEQLGYTDVVLDRHFERLARAQSLGRDLVQ